MFNFKNSNEKWKHIYLTEMQEYTIGQSLTDKKEVPNGIKALVSATGKKEDDILDLIQELGFDPEKLTKKEYDEVLKHVDGLGEETIEIPEPEEPEEMPEPDIDVEIPEAVNEQDEEVSSLDNLDRPLYYILTVISQALDGDEGAISTINNIQNIVLDGKFGLKAKVARRITDKLNQKDDVKAGSSPRLKMLFNKVLIKLNKSSKEEEKENKEENEEETQK
jgi:hypothetical protein